MGAVFARILYYRAADPLGEGGHLRTDRRPCGHAPLRPDGGLCHGRLYGPSVPCHRVVDRFGGTKACFDTFAPGTQRALLEAEGVTFRLDGTVDLAQCLWEP